MNNILSNTELLFCFRIFLASVAGLVLGIERSHRFKSAGIRVYTLVAIGGALLGCLSILVPAMFGSGDPGRIAAAVVSGVSFICIAIIYRQGTTLRGLTTAVGLWITTAIGMCFAAGFYIIAAFTTVIVFIVQSIMHILLLDNDSMAKRDVTIHMVHDLALKEQIVAEIAEMGAAVSGRSYKVHEDGTVTYSFVLKPTKKIHFEDMVALMERHKDLVTEVTMG